MPLALRRQAERAGPAYLPAPRLRVAEPAISALHRAAEGDGTFCYTFFKAVALR